MIKMTGETVERTLQGIIDKYNEAVGRGDGKSISHAMDIWALYDAILCVRQSHTIHDFKFNEYAVTKDQLNAMLTRRKIQPSNELFYAMYAAYTFGAESYRRQLVMAMDEAVNKEKYATCDSYDDGSLYPVSPTESEVK